jgi:hypothetical protein
MVRILNNIHSNNQSWALRIRRRRDNHVIITFDCLVVVRRKTAGPNVGRGTDCSLCTASWFSDTRPVLRIDYIILCLRV